MVKATTEQTIRIRMNSLYEEVRIRLYFKGESLKRKDADYCTIQAGVDEDRDVLRGFAESALNEISQAVVKRMSRFDWEIGYLDEGTDSDTSVTSDTNSDTFSDTSKGGTSGEVPEEIPGETPKETPEEEYITLTFVPYERMTAEDEARMCRIAARTVFDYMVNFMMSEWLLTVNPEVALDVVGRNDSLLFKVRKAFAGLGGMVRRRATDLAGI